MYLFRNPDWIPADIAFEEGKKGSFSQTALLVQPQIHMGFLIGSPFPDGQHNHSRL